MQQDQIEIHAFGPDHIEGAVALSRQENWPHRPQDWQMALELSSGVVALGGHGQVTGTILVTPYGADCAMINMVIVDRTMRGKGLGRRLMNEALALAEDRPLRLVATRDGMPLYEKLGFVPSGTIQQHQGQVAALSAPDEVEAAATVDLSEIKAMDREAYGADREALIDALAERGQFAVIRRNGVIEAYAAIRPFGRGEVIGPVIAGSVEDAKALVAFLAASRAGAFLRVDTDSRTGIANWLTGIGLVHVGGGVTMDRPSNRGAVQARPKVYALANQALG
ncbi:MULTISPECIES: GNAT family N-acetyltransferase [unclassified Mesorhizobium]|uniref:GNAT family N-acetyltransferase n=1 Tax=unclassified Mesorhizobium TaxID=325217 RepID=UPI000FD48EB7|nr:MULTISPECIES: GNAT family N-acetyltransferase [unclassified Mesorhizobium]RUX10345.1 N-acetyltransferase [Mesorhizobium sp. M8A.F.Ca.ET.059.01.1.1]TGP95531.1 N-acetyltransferase [Mesorhizobium sp. M8A.F.Ca.ET.218.01.1.1]TGT18585.1 N-acetyltransferase [Mesorhizobium sp. M8A.F.Ca.ET.213.01.1.1]TGT89596.1 N-acetyltransferase [Mesorhizobium sp. M8A.F.Ca.ET.161.01.1.1]TGV42154.1 N-acetyltransferase [Mesorhizobium sp. M8A.F.Ca.ET.142.01.1.1]